MRKRGFHIVLSLIMVVTSMMPFTVLNAEQMEEKAFYQISEYDNDEILLKVSATCSDARRLQLFREANVEVIDACDNYYVVKAKDELKTTLCQFENSTYILEVQPNFVYEASSITYEGNYTSGDITFSQNQWALKNDGSLKFEDEYKGVVVKAVEGVDVNVTPLWEELQEVEGKEIVVALIDSGVDISHPALEGSLWKNTKEIKDDGVDNDNNGYIDDYDGYNTFSYSSDITDEVCHGTHCAGIIGANGTENVWGVTGNSNVKIMPVKVFSSAGSGDPEDCYANSFSILRGLKYANANGAAICNMSLGMRTNDQALQDYMYASDMLFVCAAGNSGSSLDARPTYPAYYDFSNIISVANIRCDGVLHYSSNYGKDKVAVAAPGTQIYNILPENKYGYLTGTSMATPYVAGVAALLYSYTDNINAATIKNNIIKGSKSIEPLYGMVAGGLVDAYTAYHTDATAPTIATKTTVYKAKGYAKVKLSVKDYGYAGLKCVRWAKGSKKLSDFKSGAKGTKVNSAGSFTVKTSGYYTIYASDKEGNEIIKKIKVTIPVPNKITMKRTEITIKKGNTYTLSPKVSPTGVYVTYTYTSSNKKIATVTSKGKIAAKRVGKANITIKTQNGKKLVCKITVK